jgi:hypothetical protein
MHDEQSVKFKSLYCGSELVGISWHSVVTYLCYIHDVPEQTKGFIFFLFANRKNMLEFGVTAGVFSEGGSFKET